MVLSFNIESGVKAKALQSFAIIHA